MSEQKKIDSNLASLVGNMTLNNKHYIHSQVALPSFQKDGRGAVVFFMDQIRLTPIDNSSVFNVSSQLYYTTKEEFKNQKIDSHLWKQFIDTGILDIYIPESQFVVLLRFHTKFSYYVINITDSDNNQESPDKLTIKSITQ